MDLGNKKFQGSEVSWLKFGGGGEAACEMGKNIRLCFMSKMSQKTKLYSRLCGPIRLIIISVVDLEWFFLDSDSDPTLQLVLDPTVHEFFLT